jgi:hypothetical protein
MTVEQSQALQAERVAVLYRRIVLLVGAQLVWNCGARVLVAAIVQATGAEAAAPVLALLVIAASLALSAANAVFAYQLTREMGSPVPWLWTIVMFVPCLNVLALLALSSNAQSWCKERGIRVGFLGPTRESIAELKRRSLVDRTFE